MTYPTDTALVHAARRRVWRKIGFLIHLLIFLLVNAGLWLINELHGGYRWSVWPLAGWGLGLGIHGLVTFLSLAGDGWVQRMVNEEAQRLRRQQA
ncbi:2TM domain-containing protein [Schlegelella sp. S2-27]|uniref:2TM domain-containing protein n=1 Tax=Caldimonas mangrovi TaxID=2944811 RepID=A0ABT0YHG2_9BURK|nr:2TM domain-containing protein [Caldimonas mangrovi]MCM5678162.1 2TM domain-containing protein [Caldimonas mangrovi]